MRKLVTALLAAAGVFVFGSALADLTVKDGGGVTRTLYNFACQTTKLCNATAIIKSDGSAAADVKAANTVANTDVGLVVAVANTNTNVANNADDVSAGSSAGSPVVSYSYVWDGTNWDRQPKSTAVLNPCETIAQSYAPISITTATTTRIVAPSASNKTYICSLFLTSAAADNVGIVEGTGGTCGTGTAGVIGGTTAANGPNFAANGGVMLQAGGKTAVAQTAGTNVDLCLITSAATPLAGGIKYVQAP